MVYALTKRAAASLSEQIRQGLLVKEYYAVAGGIPDPLEGEMTDLLYKDSRSNKSYTVSRMRRGVRQARLTYRTLKQIGDTSLVDVRLDTGRFHQIRVQFASRGIPLVNDRRYGGRGAGDIMLFSRALEFTHPAGGDKMRFEALPEAEAWKRYL
ncbi:MAG: RluA family pseudouridine synthase, partial [Oscillospiraceae bacterium]|nr:RluA family pseudouridine synthase [Oscillospiraceae bacterium]